MGLFQNNYFCDSFNNDGQTDTPLSPVWFLSSGTWQLNNNQAVSNVGGYNLALCPIGPFRNWTVGVTVATPIPASLGSYNIIGVATRVGYTVNGLDGYLGVLSKVSSGHYTASIQSIVEGPLATTTSLSGSAVGTLSLNMISTQLYLSLNGVVILTVDDTSLDCGQSGIISFGNGGLTGFSASAPLENGGSCCQ